MKMENPNKNILCQTCLCQLDIPINLFASNYSGFLDILQRLLAFQLSEYVEGAEFNICQDCHGKLVWISDFQVACLKSLEPLRHLEYIKIEPVKLPSQFDERNSDVDSDYHQSHVDASSKRHKKRSSANKRVNKETNKVLQLIDELYSRMVDMKYRKCIVCDFVGKSTITLRSHMTRSHKDRKNWCMNCNLDSDDLQNHRETVGCHLWKCQICKKNFAWAKTLRRHLKVVHYGRRLVTASKTIAGNEDPSQVSSKPLLQSSSFTTSIGAGDLKQCEDDLKPPNLEVRLTPCTKIEELLLMNVKDSNKQIFNSDGGNLNLAYEREDGQDQAQSSYNDSDDDSKRVDIQDVTLIKKQRHIGHTIPYRLSRIPLPDVLQAIKELDSYKTDLKSRKCVVCDFIGKNSDALRCHMKKNHKNITNDWCEICNVQVAQLQQHRETARCNIWTCKFCQKEFTWVKFLMRHLRTHGRIGSVNVPSKVHEFVLKRYKQYPKDEVVQVIEDYAVKRRTCTYCSHIASSARNLVNHMRELHGSYAKSWCGICNQQTDNLQLHEKTARCLEFRCVFCKRKCFQIGNLLQHLKKHCVAVCVATDNAKVIGEVVNASSKDVEGDYCPFCKKSFGNIALHMTQVHEYDNSNEKDVKSSFKARHLCPICGKTLKTLSRLDYHVSNHSDKKSFKCTICGKCYSSAYILKQHSRLHSASIVCDICGKHSSALMYHKRHMATHLHKDDKPYKCNLCPYSAFQSFSLTTHMKQHPEDTPQASNPHKCLHCQRAFSTNALLLSHVRLKHAKICTD